MGIGIFDKYPPCPGNPDHYTWVETKEKNFWRKKRGSVKPAVLNDALRRSVEHTRLAAPAARRLIDILRPHMHGITTGRLNVRFVNGLRASLKEKGQMQLRYLKDVELQNDYHWEQMWRSHFQAYSDAYSVTLKIDLYPGCIKIPCRHVSDFYFDAILVSTNLQPEERIFTDMVTSQLYPVKDTPSTTCTLQLDLPHNKDWMLVLKLSTLEGNALSAHTKYYRMKVISGRESA